jgi:ABC-type transport system involved in multi-copper enzyme maturation permease subunit
MQAFLVLLRYDLGQMGRSWIVRAWIGLLVLPGLFLVGVAASENELASETMWAYMAAVLAPLSWLAVSIYSASAVNGESNVLADAILSKSVTRSEYLSAKLVSRVGLTVGVYFAVTVPLALLLARYAAPDTTALGLALALVEVATMLAFLAAVGILLSTLFRNSQLSILSVMTLVLMSGAALQFLGMNAMSVTSILTGLPETLRGETSVWEALQVASFFTLLGAASGSGALWTFRRKDL